MQSSPVAVNPAASWPGATAGTGPYPARAAAGQRIPVLGDTAASFYTVAMTDAPAPARPSASVAVVRQAAQGLEVLLVKRNEKIAFHGGAWVFPGGRVDGEDGIAGAPESELAQAARAAIREAREEAGLDLHTEHLLPFAHWTTPSSLPKRFATWFFLAEAAAEQAVRIDHSEIVEYRWMTPQEALARHAEGAMNLPGPTYVSLLNFSTSPTTTALHEHLLAHEVQRFLPRLLTLETGHCAMYEEDAGYETRDFGAPGRRHRLLMLQDGWQYQRDFPLRRRV